MSAGIVWLLLCAALVLFMTPGLAFFYGGLVKAKSVVSMMMLSFGSLGLIGVLWILYGFSIFSITGTSSDWIPGFMGNPFESFAMANVNGVTAGSATYAATFAIITVALISGAVADRAKFGSWLLFAGIWATISYFPVAGWVWALDADGAYTGWIANLGTTLFGPESTAAVMDWAGGTVVHINAGAAALALAIVLGKRVGFQKGITKPHNVPLVLLGAAILWFGWFGFNAGAAVDDNTAGVIFLNTLAAPAAGILGWIVVEKLKDGKSTSIGAASGAVAGLVAITPACANLLPGWAILLGVIAGVVSALAIDLKFKLGYDDSLDVVGIHLVSGFIGCLYLGFFGQLISVDEAGNQVLESTGLFLGGNTDQLILQAISAFSVAIYSFIVAFIIGFVIEKTIGFRVKSEDEVAGIDTVLHGEEGYAIA